MDFSALPLVIPFLNDFPIEIYNEILKFCDPSTLANTSRVSLAFLELSSPLLYRDVKLVGFEQMEKLFCDRKSSHPLVEHHLSFRHIRTFTIILRVSLPQELVLSTVRFPPSQPLELDELYAEINQPIDFPLHLFNPSLATFSSPPLFISQTIHVPYTHSLAKGPLPQKLRWSRISKLLLRNCKLEVGLNDPSLVSTLLSIGTRVDEVQNSFEDPRVLPGPARSEMSTSMKTVGALAFWGSFVFDTLPKLLAGSRAVGTVVVRGAGETSGNVENGVVRWMGRGTVDRLKEEGRLRFEGLEEE